MKKKYYVYALYSPFNAECFYVGLTTNVEERMLQHMRTDDCGNPAKKKIIDSFKVQNRKPLLEILWTYTCGIETANKYEMYWIEKKRSEGAKLVNILKGGIIPPSYKGKKASPKLKQKLIEASTQKKAVAQYTKQGELVQEFIGVREAWRQTGIDHRSIAQVAGGSKIRKSAGGYLWKYI